MSAGMTFISGISSFFSIWQICILQISPFFVAFMVGLYLLELDENNNPAVAKWLIPSCASYGIGFSIFYALFIASGLRISRVLIYNIGSLRLMAGAIILVASLYLLLHHRTKMLRKRRSPLMLSALSLLIGISFAIMYSPCITPTLSDILGLASQQETAARGWYLAFFYGLGISVALVFTTVIAILLLKRRSFVLDNTARLTILCGVILLIPAILNLSGHMRNYKALILGFLV
jgi:cytochrome c-type biogenesis protein